MDSQGTSHALLIGFPLADENALDGVPTLLFKNTFVSKISNNLGLVISCHCVQDGKMKSNIKTRTGGIFDGSWYCMPLILQQFYNALYKYIEERHPFWFFLVVKATEWNTCKTFSLGDNICEGYPFQRRYFYIKREVDYVIS